MSFELVIGASSELGSPMRHRAPERRPLVVGSVQCAWNRDADPALQAVHGLGFRDLRR